MRCAISVDGPKRAFAVAMATRADAPLKKNFAEPYDNKTLRGGCRSEIMKSIFF
jgi:hypothetical protein